MKATYGFHIVEILGQREDRLPIIATVNKMIEPSSETYDEIYSQATDFSINNGDLETFKASAEEMDLTIVMHLKNS